MNNGYGYEHYYNNTIRPFTLKELKGCLFNSEHAEFELDYYKKYYSDPTSPYSYVVRVWQNETLSFFYLTGYERLGDVRSLFVSISYGHLDAEEEAERLLYEPR